MNSYPMIDTIMFFLIVIMAIYVGIAGVARFAGMDLLCESMIPSQAGRIVVNIIYILVGLSGLYLLGMWIKPRINM